MKYHTAISVSVRATAGKASDTSQLNHVLGVAWRRAAMGLDGEGRSLKSVQILSSVYCALASRSNDILYMKTKFLSLPYFADDQRNWY